MSAFERVAKRLVKPPFNYAAAGKKYESIPFLREQKYGELPETLEELIEQSLEDEAIANFITLLVMREMAPAKRPKFRERDLKLVKKRGEPRFAYYPGDLEVKGDFGYETTVLVLGDLVVDGLVTDRFEGSPLLVAGHLHAKRMYLGSETIVGETLDVDDVVHLRFTRGGKTLLVARGAKTKLFVWTPDDSSFRGKLLVKHRVRAYPERDDPALVKLRSSLAPALAKQLDAEEPDMTTIVESNKPIWR